MKIDPSLLHRLFYPQVPAIMSTAAGGRVSAMPVVSYASVSTSPPLVAVACNPKSFTCKLAVKAKSFSLSILGASHIHQIELLATTSGKRTRDKLSAVGLTHSPGSSLAVPVIDGAEATLECLLSRRFRLGDHDTLVGLVKAAYATEAFSDFWDFKGYRPVLYTGWKDGMSVYES